MNAITEQVNSRIMAAMKSKNATELRGLRAIKSALLLAQTETGNKELSDQEVIQIIQKLAKQRKDSMAIYSEQGRADLFEKEQEELHLLQEFLPTPLTQEELTAILKTLIAETGAQSMRDMGKIMPLATAQLAGKAEGALVAQILKQLLSS